MRRGPPPDELDELKPLRPVSPSSEFLIWRNVSPVPGESVRWATLDGRFVSIALGVGLEVGRVIVLRSEGQRALVESFESALELAATWRLS